MKSSEHPAWGPNGSGVLASTPFMKLDYYSSAMFGVDAMHALGGECKRISRQLLGDSYCGERGAAISTYEGTVNKRWVGLKKLPASVYFEKEGRKKVSTWLRSFRTSGFVSSQLVHANFQGIFKSTGAEGDLGTGPKVKTADYVLALGPVLQACLIGKLGERERLTLAKYIGELSAIWCHTIEEDVLSNLVINIDNVSFSTF